MAGIWDRGKDFEVRFAPMSMRGAGDESLRRIGEMGSSRSALRGGLLAGGLLVFGGVVLPFIV
jgi:hypothetical protein